MKKLFLIIYLALILTAKVDAAPTFLGETTQNSDGTYDTVTKTANGIEYTINNRARAGTDNLFYDNGIAVGYTNDAYTGYYIGTINGNDSNDDILNLVRLFLNDDGFTIENYDKIEDPTTSDDKLYITYASDNLSGIWTVKSTASDQQISFYSVKGGTEYALYYVTPPDNTGKWITDHLLNGGGNVPALSHFTGVLTKDFPTDAVPEPATMFLLGFGLIGLAGLGRKAKKSTDK